jgi:hypothetical protein
MDKGTGRAWALRYSQTVVPLVLDEELRGCVEQGAAFEVMDSYVHMVEDLSQRRPFPGTNIPVPKSKLFRRCSALKRRLSACVWSSFLADGPIVLQSRSLCFSLMLFKSATFTYVFRAVPVQASPAVPLGVHGGELLLIAASEEDGR